MSRETLLYRSVRDLYDNYRTAYMNRKYYGYRLETIKRWNNAAEIMIAAGASTSIGGLFLGNKLEVFWRVYSGLVALLAITKASLQFSKQIERYTKLFVGHGNTYHDLYLIVTEVNRTETFSSQMRKTYREALERLKQLASEGDPLPSQRLVRRCFDEVNREIPVERLWWPAKTSKKGGKR
jgi:hypothetical protein